MKFTRVCLFVYLFVSGFSSHSSIFYLYGNVTITGEGLYILTYARHLSPLSNEGFLACHTYCDTGHIFIMVPWTRDTHTYYRPFGSATVTTCFYDFSPSRLIFDNPTFRLQGEGSNRLRHRRGLKWVVVFVLLHVMLLTLNYPRTGPKAVPKAT